MSVLRSALRAQLCVALAAPALAQDTTRVSVDSLGQQGNHSSRDSGLSADGRWVAFTSNADDLVPGDTNGSGDVFVRDRLLGQTLRVSVSSSGAQGDLTSAGAPISADGRFVVFSGDAGNLAPGDSHAHQDVFVHERLTGQTRRVSVDSAGAEANGPSWNPVLSADGRYVVFPSLASNLVAGDDNGVSDIFVHDLATGVTARVSLSTLGLQGNAASDRPALSADGRSVAFESLASNLVAGDANAALDVFVRNLRDGTTELVSRASSGAQGDAGSSGPAFSADGRWVAFQSLASNLVAGDTNGCADTFVHDRWSGATERASVDGAGGQSNGSSTTCVLSADGRCVGFTSQASNLVAGDTNGAMDVFVRDRGALPPGADTCQAGTGSVVACPCANPPAAAPRGCDNSAATGGARISSSGVASLANDTLLFVTSGELPAATSILLQGSAQIPQGLVFGQGVRCAGGNVRRLYTQAASGGSIHAPAAGDPSVSARSAALGDALASGAQRWYAVFYRDPSVLGGCPAASTFNITQTQRLRWSP